MTEKNLSYYQALPYRVELYFDDEDRVWFVKFPELPGCKAHGATREEALVAGEEVKAAWLATALEEGDEVPEPASEPSYSGRLVLRLPKGLHERAAKDAIQEGVSLNTYLVQRVTEGVERSGYKTLIRLFEALLQRGLGKIVLERGLKAILVQIQVAVAAEYGTSRKSLPVEKLDELPTEPSAANG